MSVARIGAGPFTVEDYWMPDESVTGPTGIKLAPGTDLGRCACCNAKVTYRVVLLNQADGFHYIVGRTCALRAVAFIGTTETQIKANFARMQREAKEQREVAKRAAEAAARADAQREERRATYLRAVASDNASDSLPQLVKALNAARRAAQFESEMGTPLFPELGLVLTERSRYKSNFNPCFFMA